MRAARSPRFAPRRVAVGVSSDYRRPDRARSVADPHARSALRETHPLEPIERRLAVGRPRLRLERLYRGAGIAGADRGERRQRLARRERGRRDKDRPGGSRGRPRREYRSRQSAGGLQSRAAAQPSSMTRTSGPLSGKRPLRIEQRMRQRENDQRRQHRAQQDQPPRRARRCLLARGQPEQQPNGRKRDHARRRRRDPEQPPDHRQRGKRGQQPRRGESERTEGEHYPYPSACHVTAGGPPTAPRAAPAAPAAARDRCGDSRESSRPRGQYRRGPRDAGESASHNPRARLRPG